MNNFLMETEPGIFCLFITAFLYIFQTKNYQLRCKENKILYICLFTEIVFSLVGKVVMNESIRNLCFAVCGISCFFAGWLWCRRIFEIAENKASAFINGLCICACVIFGLLAFSSLGYDLNVASFVLLFAVIAMIVVEQNNKIKVDSLTKLYNRYGMDAELKEQLRQYEREHSDSFYIIACDLDNFKHINDTWGHPEGDRALVLVATALARVGKMFSSGVFRIGGDEFVIITDTSEEGLAVDVTNAIKTELDNIDFRSDFDIEMSIGVALYDGVTPIDELLNNADKKLYEAKRKG